MVQIGVAYYMIIYILVVILSLIILFGMIARHLLINNYYKGYKDGAQAVLDEWKEWKDSLDD